MNKECVRAETLAGAIALGEATDAERDAYRGHLARCRRCVTLLCGEREIERVSQVVQEARDGESWQPDLRPTLRAALHARGARRRMASSFLLLALSMAVIAALVPTGIRELMGSVFSQHASPERAATSNGGARIAVEERSNRGAATIAQHARFGNHGLVVVHNIVTLNRPPEVVAKAVPGRAHAAAHRAPIARKEAAVLADVAALMPTQRDENAIAALRTTGTAAPPSARAEALAMVPNVLVIRDVTPIGGDSAIVPHPSAIAYDEGAEGTTAFEVSVDEHGTPVKCTITKPSGYLVLDDAVCKAAMHARYSPRTINGRPVAGIYRDAFTFRSGDEE
jgi:TonB family protein